MSKASEIVEAAINEVLPEMEDYTEGDILVDWVLVAYVTNPDEDKQSCYPQLYSNGNMPVYRAIGLLRVGLMGLSDSIE